VKKVRKTEVYKNYSHVFNVIQQGQPPGGHKKSAAGGRKQPAARRPAREAGGLAKSDGMQQQPLSRSAGPNVAGGFTAQQTGTRGAQPQMGMQSGMAQQGTRGGGPPRGSSGAAPMVSNSTKIISNSGNDGSSLPAAGRSVVAGTNVKSRGGAAAPKGAPKGAPKSKASGGVEAQAQYAPAPRGVAPGGGVANTSGQHRRQQDSKAPSAVSGQVEVTSPYAASPGHSALSPSETPQGPYGGGAKWYEAHEAKFRAELEKVQSSFMAARVAADGAMYSPSGGGQHMMDERMNPGRGNFQDKRMLLTRASEEVSATEGEVAELTELYRTSLERHTDQVEKLISAAGTYR